ncbi:sensor domain-containing diguanylate cyclase [Devosia sp. XK-2]|uniref:sensor domain-containing diguanylate cyclase n=1 Tax=Devosia sp. XK-2 TaxID=3126689 RepID=UPI0030D5361D
MFVQPLSENWPSDARSAMSADPTPSQRGFLAQLRTLTGMAGAGLVTSGMHWLEVDGARPSPAFSPDLLGPSGCIALPGDSMGPFIVAVPVPSIDPAQRYWLLLWDSAPKRQEHANLLLAKLTELVGHAAMDRRRAAEMHRRYLVERASATARIGIWSCTLPDEQLSWSDGVYDLFELPRGSVVSRAQALKMYTPETRRRMQALRKHAIETLGDFNFDAEIVTTTGKRRWMRITATVDGANGRATRIFGMKQDITEEKLLAENTRRMAETDALTGLANRALFQTRLTTLCAVQCSDRADALILVDLDRFKAINDELGHAQGDLCLLEAGQRLQACAPRAALVARIGGDEFAIILERQSGQDPEAICAGIVQAFETPVGLGGQHRRVGASVGMARRTGQDADALYRDADAALYRAKSAGRGTWRQHDAA